MQSESSNYNNDHGWAEDDMIETLALRDIAFRKQKKQNKHTDDSFP